MSQHDEESTIIDFLTKAEAAEPGHRVSLIIYHRDGVQVVPLVEGQPVTIGRTRPSTLTLRDKSLSRRHALFERVGGEFFVEDLASKNGTWLNGERVKRERIRVGDEVSLGSLSITIHGMTPVEGQLQGLDSHDRFCSLLNDELVRARAFSRKLALLMVEAREFGTLARWCPRIRRALRDVDRIGLYGPEAVEIIFVETDHQEARRLAEALVGERGPDEPALFCGIAVFPDDGRTPEALVEVARRSVVEATEDRPVSAAYAPKPRDAESPAAATSEESLVVRSSKMREVFDTVDQVARSAIPVLIVGETGTGKEVVARAIHERGDRREKPMRSITCGAIPESLVESALFGHERGAFTGADRQAKGVFEEANGGTVFFDEIGELALSAQVALLRVLETKRITRVGSSREVPVDARVITATHRDLEAMCKAGSFRWDLFYRLNTVVLKIPPLRERPEEIEPLTDHWMRLAAQTTSKPVDGAEPNVREILRCYHWPGNVRELRNVIERAVVVAKGESLTVEDLPERLRAVAQVFRPRGSNAAPLPPASTVDNSDITYAPEVTAQTRIDFKTRMQHFEADLIREALQRTGSNQSEAALLLGLPRRTLVYKLKAYDVERSTDEAKPTPLNALEDDELDFAALVNAHEANLIRSGLVASGGNQLRAARALGMPQRSLALKARKHGLL